MFMKILKLIPIYLQSKLTVKENWHLFVKDYLADMIGS